jgi:hypothetical protein
LRQIFEDDKIPVVFFDVRAHSNAIHGHFGGVINLQVMEMVTVLNAPAPLKLPEPEIKNTSGL